MHMGQRIDLKAEVASHERTRSDKITLLSWYDERDVLDDRQRLEKGEMLKDHADALAAGLGSEASRIGSPRQVTVPSSGVSTP